MKRRTKIRKHELTRKAVVGRTAGTYYREMDDRPAAVDMFVGKWCTAVVAVGTPAVDRHYRVADDTPVPAAGTRCKLVPDNM